MKTKKLLAVILTLALVLSLSLAAYATNAEDIAGFQADEGITKPVDISKHGFVAYQIFSGTQSTDPDDATLGAVEWGTGVNGSALLSALQDSDAFEDGTSGENLFKDCTTAADVAEVLGKWNDSSAMAKDFAKLAYANKTNVSEPVVNNQTVLDAGYYLVVDQGLLIKDTNGKEPGDDGYITTYGDANQYNLSLLQLTKKNTFAITSKVEVPSVKKEVASALTCTDTTEGHEHTKACYSWANTNQAAIGDNVEFLITAEIPAGVDNYNYYCFVIGDTLDTGLDLNADSIKVSFKKGTDETPAVATTDYTLKTGTAAGDCDFQIALTNARAHEGETVYVTYNATLNEDAIIGADGNENAVDVKFSNKPDYTYDSTDGFPGSDDPVGETPDSTTLTFVSGLKIYKVDEKGEVLTGAAFTISGDAANVVVKFDESFTKDNTNGTYYLLKDGTYTLTAPHGNIATKADDGKYALGASDPAASTDILCEDGYTYHVYAATEGSVERFNITLSNEDKYQTPTTDKYTRSVTRTVVTKDTNTATYTEAVNDNGKATFVGLPAGTYTITESTVPAGYNPIDTITVTISCTLPETAEGTASWSGKYKVGNGAEQNLGTDAEGDNVLTFTVENQKGNVLPETGGIGTTIFYVVGGVLVAAAGILLVTKKRMNNAE